MKTWDQFVGLDEAGIFSYCYAKGPRYARKESPRQAPSKRIYYFSHELLGVDDES